MRTAATLAFSLWSASGLACDCASSSLADRVKWSRDVFLGEVVAHAPLASVELRVLERFKGAATSPVVVATGRSDCDYFLQADSARPGDRFLIFMTRTAGHSVNRCLGSAPVADASADLAALRSGRGK